jgi:hypothetical protein
MAQLICSSSLAKLRKLAKTIACVSCDDVHALPGSCRFNNRPQRRPILPFEVSLYLSDTREARSMHVVNQSLLPHMAS